MTSTAEQLATEVLCWWAGVLSCEETVNGERLQLLEVALCNRVYALGSHRCFPSRFTREKMYAKWIHELRTQSGSNFRGASVGLKEDFAVGQSLETDTLCLEQRLFHNPVAEESRGALFLRSLQIAVCSERVK